MSVRVRYSDELYHYGVPGQKHGVRKYQNSDGSLTPLGRIHYGVGQARSAAAAGVTKVKRAASAGAEKVGTGVKNAASATGNFVKTNAPIAAKATGRAIGSAAKATGNAAVKGAKAAGEGMKKAGKAYGKAWVKGAKYIASGDLQKDRTRKMKERSDYLESKARLKKAKYQRRYAKQQAKEDRKMAKWRYQQEKRRNSILGKAKSVLTETADILGKAAPIGTMAMMIWLGGGFKNIAGASSSMESASRIFKDPTNLTGVGSTMEAKTFAEQIVKSTSKAMKGVVTEDMVSGFKSAYGGINPKFFDDAIGKFVK